MQIKWNQPYFTLNIRPENCRYEVRINDVPVDRMDTPASTSSDLPVNPLVFTGRNRLAAMLFPADDDGEGFNLDCRCEFSLCVRELDGKPQDRQVIESIVFSAAGLADPEATGVESSTNMRGEFPARSTVLGPEAVLVERTIELDTPFPRWLWLSAPLITDDGPAAAQLLEEYRKFHAALQAKDADAVTALTRTKALEIAAAYYGDEEEGHQLIEFREKMRDEDMELWRLDERNLTVEILADGRMARLVTPRGSGPILYRVKGQPVAAFMNTIYCRHPEGGWVQIR